MSERIVLETRASKVSEDEHRHGFQGNVGFHVFRCEGYFGCSKHIPTAIDYDSIDKRVTIAFTSSKLTSTTDGNGVNKYAYEEVGKHKISFIVPSEDDYNEIRIWVFKVNKFVGISRKYPNFFDRKSTDSIVLNDRAEGNGTCSHYWEIDANTPFIIDVE